MRACRYCLQDGDLVTFPSMDAFVDHLGSSHDVFARATREGVIRLDN